MRKIVIFTLLSYLFFQSWTSSFALHESLPIHVVLGFASFGCLGLYLLASGDKVDLDVYKSEDILLLIVVLLVAFTSLMGTNSNSLTYILAYLYVFVIAHVVLKGGYYKYVKSDYILKCNLYAIIFVALFSILEFSLNVGAGFDIGPYLHRIRESVSVYHKIFPRSTAFATEPAILAFYFETLGVLGIWTLFHGGYSSVVRWGGIAIIALGWALTFSAASVVAISIGVSFAFLVSKVRDTSLYRNAIPFLIFPLLIAATIPLISVAQETFLVGIIEKITLQQDVGSASGRLQEWTEGLQGIVENPVLGSGPGSASARGERSSLSWYIFITAEAGLFTFLALVLFLAFKLHRMLKSQFDFKYWFVAAYVAGAAHLAVISSFFHPFLWMLILIFDVLATRKQLQFASMAARSQNRSGYAAV